MPSLKISELPAATSVTADDILPLVDLDTLTTQKVTLAQIVALANATIITSVNVDGGTTGLTTSGGPITTGAGTITLDGILSVEHGGTGAVSLTGYVKGSGTSAFTASDSVPGSDVSGNISGNAANVTGVVAAANGGTGLSSPGLAGNILTSTGTGWESSLPPSTAVTLTSDVTGSGTGSIATTISSGVVTNSKLANVGTSTIKGRATAGTGSPEDLTGTQATALLDVFSSTLKGLAPSSGGGTTNYLRADGTWASPPGSGGVSDGDKGDITVSSSGTNWAIDAGVVSNSKLANVATATIKGRATAGTGSPEDLTGTQATALLDVFSSTLKGLAPSSGGGTTNFLRADGTWAAPPGLTGTVPVTSGGTGTGTAFQQGSVIFAGASGVYAQDNANLFWDSSNGRLSIGTATPTTGKLQVAGGSLAADVSALAITGTINAASTTNASGAKLSITGSGSGATRQVGLEVRFEEGYTGTAASPVALFANNQNTLGGGLVAIPFGTETAPIGVMANAITTNLSDRSAVGVKGIASNAGNAAKTARSYGAIGLARNGGGNDSTGVGVYGTTGGLATTDVAIGGMFTLYGESDAISTSTLTRAALVADNGAVTNASIFVARDNGTTTFTIDDGGYVTSKNTLDSTTAFQVQNQTGTTVLDVDTTNQRVGVGTTALNEALTVNGRLALAETTAPSLTAGYGKLYALSSDSRPYYMDDSGQAYNLTLDRVNPLSYDLVATSTVKIDVDPAKPVFNSISLTQNTTFATLNLGAGRSASVRVVCDGTTRTLTFPSGLTGWKWLGSGAPASITAGKIGYLSLVAYGTTDATVVASWAYEDQLSPVTGSGVDNQIAVWSGTSSQDGSSNLTFNGTTLGLTGGITQTSGAVSLTGNAASSFSTSTGDLTITGGAALLLSAAAGNEVVVNNGEQSVDFRVASNTTTHSLFVDASALSGAGAVGIDSVEPTSKLHVNGSFSTAIIADSGFDSETETPDIILDAWDHTAFCSGGRVVTLPSAATCPGRIYIIKNIGDDEGGIDGTVYVQTSSESEFIDDSNFYNITTKYQSLTVQSSGSKWYIL